MGMFYLKQVINKRPSHVKSGHQNDVAPFSDSENEILHTLLRHYRSLNVFGIQFTWLCFYKIYRIMLVVCQTYITDPITKLFVMTNVVNSHTCAEYYCQTL